MAPTMQQSIEVLLLPIMDLTIAVEQELQSNPLLEIDEDQPKELSPSAESQLKRDLENLLKASNSRQRSEDMEEEAEENTGLKIQETLEEHLLKQFRFEFSDPVDLKIGEFVIGNIDEDGYLTVTTEEIARAAGVTGLSRIEAVLGAIRKFDPQGIASRDLKECLLSQAGEKLNGHSRLAVQIIERFLTEMGHKKYALIARELGVPVEEIKEAGRMIALLDPKPARNYRPVPSNIYIKPDVVVTKGPDGRYQTIMNKDAVPRLRINVTYKNMLKNQKLLPAEKEFIQEKLKNAVLFMRSIEQRGQTIQEIAKFVVERQKEFFEKGHTSLVPMSLKDAAQALDRNESTISRAINQKYIDTPQGLFPLKFFFSQAVGNPHGPTSTEPSCSRGIKEEIRDLVENEDKARPLSDQDIQDHFKGKGVDIARRTINKYRQLLRILPSHLRKQ